MINDPASGRPLTLRRLFPAARYIGDQDIPVSSVSTDASSCQPGDLFVAILDADRDGHDDIREAVDRGATGVVLERHVVVPVPTCMVTDTRDALGIICQHLAGQPAQRLAITGVTGTSGKTATAHLLQSIWTHASIRSGLASSAMHHDGVSSQKVCCDTPAPQELATLLSHMAAHHCRHVALEVSSQALVGQHLAGLQLDAAIITRVGCAHLDYHGSLENYRRAKSQILSLLKPGGVAILNADDPATDSLFSHIESPRLTFGMRASADIHGTLLNRCASEQTFLIRAAQETATVTTPVIGDPHISHCLAAATLALARGMDLATIAAGLSTPQHVPGHLERIECGQPFPVYIDAANDPDTIAMALHSVRSLRPRRLICVFGPSFYHAADLRARMGRVVERSADMGIITSNDAGNESPLAITHDVLDGYDRPGQAHFIPDRLEAICWALDQARQGDAVLIAGAGFQDIQDHRPHTESFDDRQVVREWLYQRGRQTVLPHLHPGIFTTPHGSN